MFVIELAKKLNSIISQLVKNLHSFGPQSLPATDTSETGDHLNTVLDLIFTVAKS